MISPHKISKGLGVLLIISSIVFVIIDLQLLVTHWNELSYQSYKMIGSGIPQKNVLLFDIFRWLLLLIGGFGLMQKNILGWIFPQVFLLLTLYNLVYSQFLYYQIHEKINTSYLAAIIIVLTFIIVVFKFLNINTVKEHLDFYKFQKKWIWSSIFIFNVIGIVIQKVF